MTTAPISSSTPGPDPLESRVPTQTLNQKDFLKLLVASLTTQDPLNPQKDTEFIGQMAQFSALENSKALQTEMQTMRASQLLGQTVEVKINDQVTGRGVVTAIDSSSDDPKIMIGTAAYTLADIVRIDQTPPAQTQAQTQTSGQTTTTFKGYKPS
jgi:flagellar basal-body rod modification protein FlgD